MTPLSLLATIFGVIGSFVLLPQAIKIYKRKSANNISLATYIFMPTALSSKAIL